MAKKKGCEKGEMETAVKTEENDVYETKFKEMQSYIPFLEMMITRLEQNNDKSREAQLEKMKSLHSILSSTKKKLKLEILQRCEDVLQKLKAKVDKGTGKEKSAVPKEKKADNKSISNKTTPGNKKEESPPQRKMESSGSSAPANGAKSVNVILTLAARSKVLTSSGHGNDANLKVDDNKTAGVQDSKVAEVQDGTDSLPEDLDINALIRSRERLKSLLRKQDNLATSPTKSGERLNLSTDWQKNTSPLLDEKELKQISKHIMHHSDSWRKQNSEEDILSSRIRIQCSSDLYPERGDRKPVSSMWSADRNPNSYGNINLGSLSINTLNRPSSTLHSPPSSFPQSSGIFSPNRQPQKKPLPIIPPLLNVLQYPPAAGSKPLSEADIEELMEDTTKPKSDTKITEPKKEESKIRSLRAKLEEEIQQVHRVGISKGGALRGLKKVDDIMKSPVRNKADSKSSSESRKDKSPTMSIALSKEDNSAARKSNDEGRLLSPSKRNGGNEIKDSTEESVKSSEKSLDPRKRSVSPRRDDSAIHNAVENRDPRLKLVTCSETNASKERGMTTTLQDSAKSKGSILSSLSTKDLQKIVEKNLNNLPLPPPELMENLSLNTSGINKTLWQQATDAIPPMSPREFQHQDVHSAGHYGVHFDPSMSTQGSYPRSTTAYSPNYSGVRSEDMKSPLVKPEDPRLKPRTQISDPRCNSGREYQNRSLIPSSPIYESVLRSPVPQTESYGGGILPHPVSHGLRPIGQDLPQTEIYGGGLLPHPTSHVARPVGQDFTRAANPYHASHQVYQGTQAGNATLQTRWAGTPCYGVPSHSTQRPEETFGHRNASNNIHPFHNATTTVRHDQGFQYMGQPRPAHETYTVPKQPPWQASSIHGSSRNTSVNYPSSGRHMGPPSVQQQGTSKSVDPRLSNVGPGNSQLPASRSSSLSSQNSYTGTTSREGKVSDRDPRRRNSEDQDKGPHTASRSKENKVSESKTSNSAKNLETKKSNERRDRDAKKRDSTETNKSKGKETELISPLNKLYDTTAMPVTGKGYGLQKFRIPKIKRDLPKEPSPPPTPPSPSSNLPASKTNDEQSDGEVNEEDKGKAKSCESNEVNTDSKIEGKSSDLKPKEEVTQEWIEALIKKSFESGEAKKYIEQAKLLEKLGESLKGKKLKKIQKILESDSETDSEDGKSDKQAKERGVENIIEDTQVHKLQRRKKTKRAIISDDESEGEKVDSEKGALENNKPNKELTEFSSDSNVNAKLESKIQGYAHNNLLEEKPVKKYAKRRSALELLQEDIREMFICEGVVTATGHRMCRLLKEAPPDMSVEEVHGSTKRCQDEASTTAEDSDASSVVSKKQSRKFKEKKYTKKKGEMKPTKKNKTKGKNMEDSTNQVSVVHKDGDVNKGQELNADDSSSPVIKSRKKSKWKGYVIESEESNNDGDVSLSEEHKELKKKLSLESDEDIPLQDILISRKTRSKLASKSEENSFNPCSNMEHGRRTRLPRVVIEKADISKIDYVPPNRSYISYAENTSDEDISSIKGYASSETEFKPKEKTKHTARRGRRRGTGGKVRKKLQKHKSNNIAVEPNVVEQKLVQEAPRTDFFYKKKKKGKRKGNYFLGKKINDVVKRLTLRAQGKAAQIAVQDTNSLEAIITECIERKTAVNAKNKETNGTNNPDLNEFAASDTGKSPDDDKPIVCKNENPQFVDKTDLKKTRITLNLIRQTNMQKKTKKKKAKWQLGIINHSKKKAGLKSKFENDESNKCNNLETHKMAEENFQIAAVDKSKKLDMQNSMPENETNESLVKYAIEKGNANLSSTEQDKEMDTCSVASEKSAKSKETELATSSTNENITDVNFTDKTYFLDGSSKYACKLCTTSCKHIVSHYKTVHTDYEVLISRLSEVEAEIAIADAKENSYEEEEQVPTNSKVKKRLKKNARTFCCSICNQIFSFAPNFYEHLTSHTGEYRFQCGKCDYKSTTRMRVKTHYYAQHPEFKGIESVSTKVLTEGPSLDAKFVVGYLCSSCNFVQIFKPNLQKHIDLRHKNDCIIPEIICINMSKIKDPPEKESINAIMKSKERSKEVPYEMQEFDASDDKLNDTAKEKSTENISKLSLSDASTLNGDKYEEKEENSVNKTVVADIKAEKIDTSRAVNESIDSISVEAKTNDITSDKIESKETEQCNNTVSEVGVEGLIKAENKILNEALNMPTESKSVSIDTPNMQLESEDLPRDTLDMLVESKLLSSDTQNVVGKVDELSTSESEMVSIVEETKTVDEKIFVYPNDIENEDNDEKSEQMKILLKNLDGKSSFLSSECDVLERLLDSVISENEVLSTSDEKRSKEPSIEEQESELMSQKHIEAAQPIQDKTSEKSKYPVTMENNVKLEELKSKESISSKTNASGNQLVQTAIIDEDEVNVESITNESDTTTQENQNGNILHRILTGDIGSKCDSDSTNIPKISDVCSTVDGENSEVSSDGSGVSEIGEEEEGNYADDYKDPPIEEEVVLLDEVREILNKEDPLHRIIDIIGNLASLICSETELKKINQDDLEVDTQNKIVNATITKTTESSTPKTKFNAIPQVPPLIAVDAKQIMTRRGTTDKTEQPLASIRMGPILTRPIDDKILYSCCLRGCIYATTNQTKFANHIDTNHKNVRWDGKCKACLDTGTSEHFHKIKLVQALDHLIERHLPVSSNKSAAISPIEKPSMIVDNKASISVKERESVIVNNKSIEPIPNVEEKAKTVPEPTRQLIRIRRLSGDILSASKSDVPENAPSNHDIQLSEIGSQSSMINPTKEGTNLAEDEEMPFCKISSVMSLNPDALGRGDVDVFHAGTDALCSPARSDATESDSARTLSGSSPGVELSTIPGTSVSPKGLLPLSPSKVHMLSTSSYKMCMLPAASLPNASRITILPAVQKLSPIKVNKLSPVKLANIAPKEIAVTTALSGSVPHSVVNLTRVTQPSEIKIAKSLLKSNVLTPKVPPYVRLQIADGKKSILQAPTTVRASAMLPENAGKVPIPASPTCTSLVNASAMQEPLLTSSHSPPISSEVLGSAPGILQTSPATSLLPKNKVLHKSAVAPSYAKASKVPLYYQEMLTTSKLRHLFKCMARYCSYTSNSGKQFIEHFTQHLKDYKKAHSKRGRPPICKFDWQQCVYCCTMMTKPDKLVEHIEQEHGSCLYQCAYCFFRAISASYIVLHQNTCHINDKVTVLFCTKLENIPELPEQDIARAAMITPYVCQQASCGAIFYLTDEFQNHLEKEHSQVAIYSCHKCTSQHFRADRLIAHYKLHSCCYYQCIYCVYGSDTKEEMQHHLCNSHPNKKPKIIIRSVDTTMTCDESAPASARTLEMLQVMDLEEEISENIIILDESNALQEQLEAESVALDHQEVKRGGEKEPILTPSPLPMDQVGELADNEQEKETGQGESEFTDDSIKESAGNKAASNGNYVNKDHNAVAKESSDDDIVIIEDGNNTGRGSASVVEDTTHGRLLVRGNFSKNKVSDVIMLGDRAEDRASMQGAVERQQQSQIPDLILPEPLVTLKHRNPETTVAIQTAVDPLSISEPVQNETKEDIPEALNESVSRAESDLEEKYPSQSTTEVSEPLSASTKTGLIGCALYRCGYASCTYSTETSSLLKDHLCACDMARDSPSLICVHCKKQLKHVGTLLEHLRTHGTNRFKCSLCEYQAAVPHQVAKHLKQKHRVASTKVVPLNPLESDPETAMFVVVPKERLKGKKSKIAGKESLDNSSKRSFLPEELEQLPHQAIFTVPLQCATCKYETKVRSNFYRHLQLHLLSTPDEPAAVAVTTDPSVLPSSAPVNPVPCLESNEMMFDKMTNLALSSHMGNMTKAGDGGSANSKIAENIEAKLPKFVPEHQRYVCGAPNCSYLTCDETMLRYHLRALHFDETAYRCPHCPDSAQDNNGHIISIERMGAHLKMHDNRLYKCAHCMYNHFQRHVVERHLADKHPEKRPYVHVVREPDAETTKQEDTAASSVDADPPEITEVMKNPWHCGLCKHQSATRADVLDHTWTIHGLKSQYKCGLCSFRSSSRASLDSHFSSKHPNSTVEIVHVYRKVDGPKVKSPSKTSTSQEGTATDAHPVWRRDDSRLRHIRGIFLDEEVQTTIPPKQPSIKTEINMKEDEKYGPFGEPFGESYVCPRCTKYRSKHKADFRDHLYRELQYRKWVCTHCGLMSCNRNTVMKHTSKVHEREGKLESIVALTPDEEIEGWVKRVISTQTYIMKHVSAPRLSSAERSAEVEGSIKEKQSDKPSTSSKMLKKSEEAVLKIDNASGDEESINSAPVPSVCKVRAPKRYECKRCGLKFSLTRGLKLHARINHLKLGKWMCAYCDYVTNAETILLQHCNLRHPELPLKCLPNNRGSTEVLDDAFWEREFGIKPEEASASTAPQKRKASVSEDQGVSEDGHLNRCQQCDYSCHSTKDMKQHMIRHWVQKPFKCGYCDFEGLREYDIKKHSAKSHPMKKFRILEVPVAGKIDTQSLSKRFKSKGSKLDAHASGEGSDDADSSSKEDDSNNEEEMLMYRCFYCPQRASSIVTIHQHWEEKHKNGSTNSNGISRFGLPFKYKEVNLKQYVKGEDNSAGRRPSLLCAYCDFRGCHSIMEVHHRSMHSDKPFRFNRSGLTRYECAVCHFAAFTVNTLKRHFDMEHASEEFRYIVRSGNEEAAGSTSSSSQKSLDRGSPLPTPHIEVMKYMCLWCEKTYDSELKIQAHHNSQHSDLQLKYSVEKISAPSQLKGSTASVKRFQCPCCTFGSNNYTSMCEHLRRHTKPYQCGYCSEAFESPNKVRSHIQHVHPSCKYNMVYLTEAETELAELKSDIVINSTELMSETGKGSAKRENSGDRTGPAPKKLCVARKSTGSIQGRKFHAVARKSTTYRPWQRSPSSSPSPPQSDTSDFEDKVDIESIASSVSKTETYPEEFSFYGCTPTPVDTNKIMTYVKLKSYGISMNMNVATMEKFTNLYPVVRVRKLVFL